MASRAAEGDEQTRYEIKYDPTGDFDQYREYVQRTMEKPYPDNGGFYGMGSLAQMGLRRSRHEGDFRDQSEFKNREEGFKQPLKGLATVLERGTNIRGAGGVRAPSNKTAEGEAGPFSRPPDQEWATVEENLALIQSLGTHITIPKEVAQKRAFENELRALHNPEAFPGWDMKFAVKLFQTYRSSYPGYRDGVARPEEDPDNASGEPKGVLETDETPAVNSDVNSAPAAAPNATSFASGKGPAAASDVTSFASGRSLSSSKKALSSTRSISTTLALKIDVRKGVELPKMDATGVTDTEGCDAYVVLRYDGQERFRTKTFHESYSPVWDETFILENPKLSRSSPLILQVWDSDDLQDEMIGQCNINFFDLLKGKPLEKWYVMTAESAKAFNAVQQKGDTSHAGKILLSLTLGFAHEFHTPAEEVAEEEIDTTVYKPYGEVADAPGLEDNIGRLDLKNKDARTYLMEKLLRIRKGINYTSKPDLYRAIDSLASSQSHQARENVLEARQLVDQAIYHARRVLKLEFTENEDTVLAAKVLMASLAAQKPTERQAVSEECRQHMKRIGAIPEMISALDDELAPSDPDRKILRSSDTQACACTENQPGARKIRHRMLADMRCITQAALEELAMARAPPGMWRPGRDNTEHPGPEGREVDNELELLPASTPHKLQGHAHWPVTAVAFHGEWIFSASADKSICVWDLGTLERVGVIDLHHRDEINCLAVGAGGFDMMLFSGSNDHTIKAYNISPDIVASGKTVPCVHTITHHQAPVTCLLTQRFYPEDEYSNAVRGWRLYSGSADCTIQVLEAVFIGKGGLLPDDPQPFGVLRGHTSTVTTLAVARARLFSGSLDATIRVWDCESLAGLLSVSLDGNGVNGLSVAFGKLYAATGDSSVHVYSVDKLQPLTKMEGHTGAVSCLATTLSRHSNKPKHLIQNKHPVYERPHMAGMPLTFDCYEPGAKADRFVTVTVSVRKVLGLADARVHRNAYVTVTLGGPVRISGREYYVEEQTRRTKVVGRTLDPRWNETFTFVMPELPDYREKSGSSMRQLGLTLDVWDWKVAGDSHLGQWKGCLGDSFPDGPLNLSNVPGADGSGTDGQDSGGWVYLEPRASVVGRDLEAVVGLKVGMSEEGMRWMAQREIANHSQGRAGYISSVSEDGTMCRVLWEATIGQEKEGVLCPKGWESHISYATGRQEHYYLMKWDETPQRHGRLLFACHVTPPVAHEPLPLEPHRALLFSGSRDASVRVWDLHSHTCVAVLEGQHSRTVTDLTLTPSGRLLSASQDAAVCLW